MNPCLARWEHRCGSPTLGSKTCVVICRCLRQSTSLSIRRHTSDRRGQAVASSMLQQHYLQEIEAASNQALDVVIYGDSITEAFRGTTQGHDDPTWDSNHMEFERLIGSQYKTAVYSIAGEQAVGLLCRIQNGGGPKGLNVRVVMVMIGTNDIFTLTPEEVDSAEQVADTIFEVLEAVLDELAAQAPAAKLVALSLPPLQPQWGGDRERERYQPVVDAVNARLQRYAAQHAPQVLYADCTSPFLLPGPGRRLDASLAPDGCHPEGPGAVVLAGCVLRALKEALGEGSNGGDES